MTSEDKGKKPEEGEWVRKDPEKEVGFDLEHVKETFMEAKKSFIEASTPGGQDRPAERDGPFYAYYFLGDLYEATV